MVKTRSKYLRQHGSISLTFDTKGKVNDSNSLLFGEGKKDSFSSKTDEDSFKMKRHYSSTFKQFAKFQRMNSRAGILSRRVALFRERLKGHSNLSRRCSIDLSKLSVKSSPTYQMIQESKCKIQSIFSELLRNNSCWKDEEYIKQQEVLSSSMLTLPQDASTKSISGSVFSILPGDDTYSSTTSMVSFNSLAGIILDPTRINMIKKLHSFFQDCIASISEEDIDLINRLGETTELDTKFEKQGAVVDQDTLGLEYQEYEILSKFFISLKAKSNASHNQDANIKDRTQSISFGNKKEDDRLRQYKDEKLKAETDLVVLKGQLEEQSALLEVAMTYSDDKTINEEQMFKAANVAYQKKAEKLMAIISEHQENVLTSKISLKQKTKQVKQLQDKIGELNANQSKLFDRGFGDEYEEKDNDNSDSNERDTNINTNTEYASDSDDTSIDSTDSDDSSSTTTQIDFPIMKDKLDQEESKEDLSGYEEKENLDMEIMLFEQKSNAMEERVSELEKRLQVFNRPTYKEKENFAQLEVMKSEFKSIEESAIRQELVQTVNDLKEIDISKLEDNIQSIDGNILRLTDDVSSMALVIKKLESEIAEAKKAKPVLAKGIGFGKSLSEISTETGQDDVDNRSTTVLNMVRRGKMKKEAKAVSLLVQMEKKISEASKRKEQLEREVKEFDIETTKLRDRSTVLETTTKFLSSDVSRKNVGSLNLRSMIHVLTNGVSAIPSNSDTVSNNESSDLMKSLSSILEDAPNQLKTVYQSKKVADAAILYVNNMRSKQNELEEAVKEHEWSEIKKQKVASNHEKVISRLSEETGTCKEIEAKTLMDFKTMETKYNDLFEKILNLDESKNLKEIANSALEAYDQLMKMSKSLSQCRLATLDKLCEQYRLKIDNSIESARMSIIQREYNQTYLDALVAKWNTHVAEYLEKAGLIQQKYASAETYATQSLKERLRTEIKSMLKDGREELDFFLQQVAKDHNEFNMLSRISSMCETEAIQDLKDVEKSFNEFSAKRYHTERIYQDCANEIKQAEFNLISERLSNTGDEFKKKLERYKSLIAQKNDSKEELDTATKDFEDMLNSFDNISKKMDETSSQAQKAGTDIFNKLLNTDDKIIEVYNRACNFYKDKKETLDLLLKGRGDNSVGDTEYQEEDNVKQKYEEALKEIKITEEMTRDIFEESKTAIDKHEDIISQKNSEIKEVETLEKREEIAKSHLLEQQKIVKNSEILLNQSLESVSKSEVEVNKATEVISNLRTDINVLKGQCKEAEKIPNNDSVVKLLQTKLNTLLNEVRESEDVAKNARDALRVARRIMYNRREEKEQAGLLEEKLEKEKQEAEKQLRDTKEKFISSKNDRDLAKVERSIYSTRYCIGEIRLAMTYLAKQPILNLILNKQKMRDIFERVSELKQQCQASKQILKMYKAQEEDFLCPGNSEKVNQVGYQAFLVKNGPVLNETLKKQLMYEDEAKEIKKFSKKIMLRLSVDQESSEVDLLCNNKSKEKLGRSSFVNELLQETRDCDKLARAEYARATEHRLTLMNKLNQEVKVLSEYNKKLSSVSLEVSEDYKQNMKSFEDTMLLRETVLKNITSVCKHELEMLNFRAEEEEVENRKRKLTLRKGVQNAENKPYYSQMIELIKEEDTLKRRKEELMRTRRSSSFKRVSRITDTSYVRTRARITEIKALNETNGKKYKEIISKINDTKRVLRSIEPTKQALMRANVLKAENEKLLEKLKVIEMEKKKMLRSTHSKEIESLKNTKSQIQDHIDAVEQEIESIRLEHGDELSNYKKRRKRGFLPGKVIDSRAKSKKKLEMTTKVVKLEENIVDYNKQLKRLKYQLRWWRTRWKNLGAVQDTATNNNSTRNAA